MTYRATSSRRYSRVLVGPLFEVVVVPAQVLYGLGVNGIVRWDAPATSPPSTYAELVEHDRAVRGLERLFTESASVVAALAAFAGPGMPVPSVVTNTDEVRLDVESFVGDLDQPVATVSLGGIAIGLLVTAAGAGFAVRKRETEIRLLRADGDAGWRFAARAVAQYLPPAVVGTAIGLGATWAVGSLSGDDVGARTDAIDMTTISLTAAAGLGVAAFITGFAASRVLDVRPSSFGSVRARWLLPVIGLAVAAWIQVGAAGDRSEVDPLVLIFPMVGLAAGVGVGALAVRWMMHRAHRTGSGLPTALFLAWRRITSAEPGAVLLAAAMGMALGLIVFSGALVGSLSTAVAAKSAAASAGVPRPSSLNGSWLIRRRLRRTCVCRTSG